MTEDDFDLLVGTLNLWKKKLLTPKSKPVPKAKPVAFPKPIKFDDAMRRLVRLPPPATGNKAKKKVWRKKKR